MKVIYTIFVFLVILFPGCSKKDDPVPAVEADQYITWEVNGKKYSITSPTDQINVVKDDFVKYTRIDAFNSDHSLRYSMRISALGTGRFALFPEHFIVQSKGPAYLPEPYVYLMVDLTEYGSTGGYIAGTIDGTVNAANDLKTRIPFKSQFRIKAP